MPSRLAAAALLLAFTTTMTSHADVLRLADGTTYTGVLLDHSTTSIRFQQISELNVLSAQVAFIRETGTSGSNLILLPQPQHVQWQGATVPFKCVYFDPLYQDVARETTDTVANAVRLTRVRDYLTRAFHARGIRVLADRAGSEQCISITLRPKNHVLYFTQQRGPEAYAIDVESTGVMLAGTTPKGVWNAAQTLIQLITGDAEHGFEIEKCNIQDYPSIPRRICHLPRLTHKSDLELLRRYARMLARFKFNTLILENSGAIKLDKHPEAWWSDGFTKYEIRSLIADFKDLGFEVIPQLNSFGHVDEWLGAEPGDVDKYDLNPLFSTTEYRDTLNPCNPRVYDILFDCYTEMLDVYGNPPYFHVGLDEARRRGFGHNSDCKGTDPHQIFAAHANRIGEFFAARHVTPVMWADLLLDPAKFPGIDNCNGGPPTNFTKTLPLIKQPYVLMDWHYDCPDPLATLQYLNASGHAVWATPWKDPVNTYGHAQAAERLQLQGICATTWNFFDRGADYMREIDILSAPIRVANYAWNPDADPPGAANAWDEKQVFSRVWPQTVEKW